MTHEPAPGRCVQLDGSLLGPIDMPPKHRAGRKQTGPHRAEVNRHSSLDFTALVIWACLTLPSSLACTDDGARQRQAFVKAFVTSVYEGTDQYKRFLTPSDQAHVEEYRKRMTASFRIDRVDESGFSADEYYVAFENNATGVVYVAHDAGQIRQVGFYVFPPGSK